MSVVSEDALPPRFVLTPEHEALRESVRRLLDDHCSEVDVRRAIATEEGQDRALWRRLVQLGLPGLLIPSRYGGEGCTYVELLVVMEELGRSLACVPYLSTVGLAVNAILLAGDEGAAAALLPDIAAGRSTATLALHEGPDAPTAGAGAGAAEGEHRISGTLTFVADGHVADVLLVAARTERGRSLFAVDAAASGVDRRRIATLDLTRPQAQVVLDDAPARLVGVDGGAEAVLDATLDRARVALAAEQVGAMQAALDMAVAYAKDRVQFGRPIGSFQAIKHKCADMLLRVESARSAAYDAAWAVASGDDEAVPVAACVAQAYCSDALTFTATENIQIHGGIGFTWEHPAHLYFRRAKASEVLFGTPAAHRALLARRLGIGG